MVSLVYVSGKSSPHLNYLGQKNREIISESVWVFIYFFIFSVQVKFCVRQKTSREERTPVSLNCVPLWFLISNFCLKVLAE